MKIVPPVWGWEGRDSDPQVLVYDKTRQFERYQAFDDNLQRLFAFYGHPPCIFAEVTIEDGLMSQIDKVVVPDNRPF